MVKTKSFDASLSGFKSQLHHLCDHRQISYPLWALDSSFLKKGLRWTSPAIQWLRIHASTAMGMGLISIQGTKISHAMQCCPKNRKKTKMKKKRSNSIRLNELRTIHQELRTAPGIKQRLRRSSSGSGESRYPMFSCLIFLFWNDPKVGRKVLSLSTAGYNRSKLIISVQLDAYNQRTKNKPFKY